MLTITPEELAMIAMMIESTGTGYFASRIRRYLKTLIDGQADESGDFTLHLDRWPATWLLSTLYLSEVVGPSASLMYKLEDFLESTETNLDIIT